MRRLLLALLLVGCSSTSDKKDVTEVDALARSGELVADMVADSSGDVVPDLPVPLDIVETTDEVVPVADLAADLPPEVVPPPRGHSL